ncbi:MULTISPECIES: hypothetical protein [Arthrospira]|uniref:hypothetical protein n=1 Tax=Limnospira TaxID=2596745 RepID=UPI0001D0E9FC|nr:MULTISPECIES: hypothetical protein [Arthrospira]MBD2670964.1 hypothetical protein [Arthrospira platensis FACHB-439]MBD2710328.1 hypothetical protein [Arthrospira platensis FACHB-835]MDF2210780.1 hypothetical protein [Arthrospira platensis NCB002]MDT9184253.1 hypothetical protein [Limnospira sp. PMC 289.06]MDT9297621.1 hypothetical protein [Arthrospira platensis PCC 7345]MDT9312060.1 hypothetical protein [Limnospira sp. Paracas R14]BAI89553.1 hypothetical protein NIES39_D01330 [Arthrospira
MFKKSPAIALKFIRGRSLFLMLALMEVRPGDRQLSLLIKKTGDLSRRTVIVLRFEGRYAFRLAVSPIIRSVADPTTINSGSQNS